MAIILQNINGLSDSKWSGIKDSVYRAVGLDLHSEPGVTKVQQALKKDSGSTVTEFCRVAVACSNGYSFWFSYTSGKIWARSSGGTWSLAYTTSPAAGSAGCLGATEFNGYIYWATESRLHRIAIADADDSWASVSANWQTFAVTNSSFHPMAIQDLTLWIGDGNQIASVDDTAVFNNNALDLKTPYVIKCLVDYEIDLLIGTVLGTNDNVNRTELLRWDCVSTSWQNSQPIEEVGINCFIKDGTSVYANAGLAGNIYFYNGQDLVPYIKIPGIYTKTAYGSIYPNSSGNFQGRPVFGFSNGSGNPALQGIYTLGSYSRNYPTVLDLSFVNSQNSTSSQEMGALLVIGFDLMTAWKDGSNYGVDIIDWSNKYTGAYFETTMLFQADRDKNKTFQEVSAFYNSLPASTGITFSYSINGASYVSMTSVTDSIIARVYALLTVENVGSLQIKVAFTVSSNSTPVMEALGLEIS